MPASLGRLNKHFAPISRILICYPVVLQILSSILTANDRNSFNICCIDIESACSIPDDIHRENTPTLRECKRSSGPTTSRLRSAMFWD